MKPAAMTEFAFDWTYPLAFLWGILVVVALVGWGRAVGRWLMPASPDEERTGWGLEAAWGLCLFLLLSGPALMLSLFSISFIAIFLCVGWILWGWNRRRCSPVENQFSLGGLSKGKLVCLGLLGCTALLMYAGAVAAHGYNMGDDFAAYFALSKMMLDMGTLYDPYSFRLLCSLAGQQALSTLIVAFLPWKYAKMLDMGIAMLILLGMSAEGFRVPGKKFLWPWLIFAALILTFPMPRNNTNTELTTSVFLVALFLSIEKVFTRGIAPWKSALLVGGVVAAASMMRCHTIIVIGLTAISLVAWSFLRRDEISCRVAKQVFLVLGITAIFLMPWSEVLYKSSRVFLYPLIKGTQRPDFEIYDGNLSAWETAVIIGKFFWSTNYALFFVPVCFLRAGRQRDVLRFVAIILILLSILFLARVSLSEPDDLYRYLAPIGFAFAFYCSSLIARQAVESMDSKEPFFSRRSHCMIMIGALGMLVANAPLLMLRSAITIAQICWSADNRNQMYAFGLYPVWTDEAERDYHEASAKIPVGEKVLISVDYPFLLDYKQHAIFDLDIAGAASPDPGMPYFQGAEALKKYLLSQGIHYIAHVPFDQTDFLHSTKRQKKALADTGKEWVYLARFEMDFQNNVNQLARLNPVTYDSRTIRVIDLRN